ncbi:DsbA family oxidoreductase [Vagococcus intermedius]|uniref:DsbA family oxidoreductase n=1 Tax=Vagococcus intermedius TaxID=2991418 RepID=A0AAF0CT98_9ENTE|nr:DsbA family oxidoreductase [Vagococcus intermedius]WEG72548.1 DsbA family oxidoreductase [Vagococcus intermedius]WEG74634.1 DsbA family oxidoreductase [Vagococcus intermedius]
MKIDIWSDFACPFCYIGERRLQKAINLFPYKDDITVSFKSFELDPTASNYTGIGITEALAQKYDVSVEEAAAMNQQIAEQASGVSLDFDFDKMKPTNTRNAHRLAKYAAIKGLEAELVEKLFQAYFTEGKVLSDLDVLVEIGTSIGLEEAELKTVLNNPDAFVREVCLEEEAAGKLGINSVPFMVINDKYVIKGAQPLATFSGALQQVWEEEHPNPQFEELLSVNTESQYCEGGRCRFK